MVMDRLWIGSIHAAFNQDSMQDRGITHVSEKRGTGATLFHVCFAALANSPGSLILLHLSGPLHTPEREAPARVVLRFRLEHMIGAKLLPGNTSEV